MAGRLRELSQARRDLIAALTRRALAGAGQHDAPVALQEEVAATLTAAVADPKVAAELAAGTLVRPVERSGFGFGPAENAPGAGTRAGTATPRAMSPGRRGSGPDRSGREISGPNGPARTGRNGNRPNASGRNGRPNGPGPNASRPSANGARRSPPRSRRYSRLFRLPMPRNLPNGPGRKPSASSNSNWKTPRTCWPVRSADPARPPWHSGTLAAPSTGSARAGPPSQRRPAKRAPVSR